jgi:cytochrome c oxidase cbb3-type subunit 4
MSPLVYEDLARFAQQGGTVYFGVLFFGGLIYALWPRHGAAFKQLASLPLETHEDDHVQP